MENFTAFIDRCLEIVGGKFEQMETSISQLSREFGGVSGKLIKQLRSSEVNGVFADYIVKLKGCINIIAEQQKVTHNQVRATHFVEKAKL